MLSCLKGYEYVDPVLPTLDNLPMNYLERLVLRPVALHEQPNEVRTNIEKFEVMRMSVSAWLC